MMRGAIALTGAVMLAIATPAVADEYYAVTPSGRAEAYFDRSVVQTSDLLTNTCIDRGWTVVETTETMVTCQGAMSFGQRLASALLIGNQYSTPPQLFYRFNLAGSGQSTRVQVNAWIETQMAFGQIRREEFSGATFHNSAMDFFAAAGGRWPPGTTFPNHAYIGLSFEVSDDPKGGRITKIEPDSPAEAADLALGDVVTRIAGERIKDGGDLLDALAKAKETPTYEVEYYRVGRKTKATLESVLRNPVVAPVATSALPENLVPAAMLTAPAPAQALSVADELAKFAKLRDEGIITSDEFEAQKAKLLGN